MPALTFGEQHPSSLGYRDRLQLVEQNTFEYNRLWGKAYRPTVWERLLEDASIRHDKKAKQEDRPTGINAGFVHTGTLSGYATNSDRACYTTTPFRSGHNPDLQPSNSVITHPVIGKRFMHKHKIDYMSTIRPDCETTNQTLRMLATYETDVVHAKQAAVHIPHMSPAPAGVHFHPDVRLSDIAFATATRALESTRLRLTRTRPGSAHPTVGRHASGVVPAPGPGPGPAPARPGTARPTALTPSSPPAVSPSAAAAAAPSPHPAAPASLPTSPIGQPLRPTSAHTSPKAGSLQRQSAIRQRPASAHPASSPPDTITRRVHWGGML